MSPYPRHVSHYARFRRSCRARALHKLTSECLPNISTLIGRADSFHIGENIARGFFSRRRGIDSPAGIHLASSGSERVIAARTILIEGAIERGGRGGFRSGGSLKISDIGGTTARDAIDRNRIIVRVRALIGGGGGDGRQAETRGVAPRASADISRHRRRGKNPGLRRIRRAQGF